MPTERETEQSHALRVPPCLHGWTAVFRRVFFLPCLGAGDEPREGVGGAKLSRGEGGQLRGVVGAPPATLQRAPDALRLRQRGIGRGPQSDRQVIQ